MKKFNILCLIAIFCALFDPSFASAQIKKGVKKKQNTTKSNKSSKSSSVSKKRMPTSTNSTNFPLQSFVLSNGLTVYISPNPAEPRIQTYIATRSGSSNDPATNTGLAHYLEHMLFKGTGKIASLDYAKEKPLLDQIESLYATYNNTTDPAKREEIYKEIDRVSGEAAKFAIPNEYDKILTSLGATGTNAFTSFEVTAYVTNIPSNQLENWLKVEQERFKDPVFRIFHTELEAVYEEKNRSLDNDQFKVYESFMSGLFQSHPYGTQTTIGTIEHLKNPSLSAIRDYYNQWYVPSNMVMVLVGDVDPAKAIKSIEATLGKLPAAAVPAKSRPMESDRPDPVIKNVYGPTGEFLSMGYRIPIADKAAKAIIDPAMISLVSNLIYNGNAGLMDLDLVKGQKILGGFAYTDVLNDYSVLRIDGYPTEGQSLDEVRTLLYGVLEKLKNGDFDPSLIAAVANNLENDLINELETNPGRANILLDLFIQNRQPSTVWENIAKIRTYTKADVQAFAKAYLANDHVVVYKRNGTDTSIVKVPKPPITPIEVNRDTSSAFAKEIMSAKVPATVPKFVNFKADLRKDMIPGSKRELIFYPNTENNRFRITFEVPFAQQHNRKLPVALNLLNVIGTEKRDIANLSLETYKLAAGFSFYATSNGDRSVVTLTGLYPSLKPSLSLLLELLSQPKATAEDVQLLIANELQARDLAMKNKRLIGGMALMKYVQYGPKNPFNNVLTNERLKALQAQDLLDIIKLIMPYCNQVTYYGPGTYKEISSLLASELPPVQPVVAEPGIPNFYQRSIGTSTFYLVDYDMVQTELSWIGIGPKFDPTLMGDSRLLNDYFGSLVFQDIRESKALAYSAYSYFASPENSDQRHYTIAGIGTQSDKIEEAFPAMTNILKNRLPNSEVLYQASVSNLESTIRNKRTVRDGVIDAYLRAQRLNLEVDPNELVFNAIQNGTITFESMAKFHAKYFNSVTYDYYGIGKNELSTINYLKQFGEIKKVSLEELFGF